MANEEVLLPEIHIAFVRPLGIDVSKIRSHFAAALRAYGFGTKLIKYSRFLADFDPPEMPGEEESYEYYVNRMNAGDALRDQAGGQILAMLAVDEVSRTRGGASGSGVAFLHDSVMHPQEVEALRQAYGSLVFVVSIHSAESTRRKQLRIRLLERGSTTANVDERVAELMLRDEGRMRGVEKQRLSREETFHTADVFLDGSVASSFIGEKGDEFPDESSHAGVRRFLRQLFSFPHGAPTVEEAAMAHAYLGALRSTALSRRVGAAVVSKDGRLLATGRNDVPKGGGGLYDGCDPRDQSDSSYEYRKDSFPILDEDTTGADSNDLVKHEILKELCEAVESEGIVQAIDADDLLQRLVASPAVRGTQFSQVIAFGRTVHAEMDAITTAARDGISLKGAILMTTTFPCHECARHIIATGIDEVVYVEPYPKSRVMQLHADAVDLMDDREVERQVGRVLIRPFVGVAHRRLSELFSFETRKHDDPKDVSSYGKAVAWVAGEHAVLRSSVVGDPLARDLRSRATAEAERLARDTAQTPRPTAPELRSETEASVAPKP